MSFRVAARTLLQLGSELISSDSIAFYELIKNGFDAGSKRVDLEFTIRFPGSSWEDCQAALTEAVSEDGHQPAMVDELRDTLTEKLDADAPSADSVLAEIARASTVDDIRRAFDRADTVVIRDSGSGMSMQTLDDVYLTIGTRYRRKEREAALSGTPRLTLGEKGMGRLSVMRLGSQMLVRTTQQNDPTWHELRIDWNRFSHDSDELIADVAISPSEGPAKDDPKVSGTEVHIWGSRHGWTQTEVVRLASTEFSRFIDPFATKRPIAIDVTYNGDRVPVPRFDRLLSDAAHATLWAEFTARGRNGQSNAPSVVGEIDYKIVGGAKKKFSIEPYDLASASRTTVSTLRAVGDFRLDLYWFNRGLLRAVEGVGDVKLVRSLLDRWGGGVAIYRDEFRVNPYGGRDDDWLDLDLDAFKAPSYKLNRRQIIAKLAIASAENPNLMDQTNREGLQHNAQFLALRSMVKHILEGVLRTFLEQVDDRNRLAKIDPIEQLEASARSKGQRVRAALRQLKASAPEAIAETGIIDSVEELLTDIQKSFKQARERLVAHEEERERLVLLAGIGLLIEIIAHELHRATAHALAMVVSAADDPGLASARTMFTSLGAQLRTLRTRLSMLDEVSVSGRQVKTTFDLVSWVRDILENHQAQFDRHQVHAELSVTPPAGPQELTVKMVRGMVVQVLENLLANSVYWLSIQRREDPTFEPRIWIGVDTRERRLTVTDNGPGIELARAEEIFLPFVTTKPPGEGKGLGLYIAREIARYHGATLRLSEERATRAGHLNTFVLSLGKAAT